MATSRIQICNDALEMVAVKPIQSIDEQSREAEVCRRAYPNIIAEMLEGGPVGSHDWSFANRRVTLAEYVNDRASEWSYSYAVPSDMATPIRVIPDLSAAGLGVPLGSPTDPYYEVWGHFRSELGTDYVIENGKIYSNIAGAILEYGVNNIEPAAMGALVRRAVTVDLASRIAAPLQVTADREEALMAAADVAWQRAIADDKNRHPERFGGYVSEGSRARGGQWHIA